MPGDAIAHILMAAAKRDLKALGNMLDTELFDDQIFGFHAQQAIEKALKAWLRFFQRSHPFTHDLGLLLHMLEEHGTDVELYWDFVGLSGYAGLLRYDTFPEDTGALNRADLFKDVKALFEQVEKMIEG